MSFPNLETIAQEKGKDCLKKKSPQIEFAGTTCLSAKEFGHRPSEAAAREGVEHEVGAVAEAEEDVGAEVHPQGQQAVLNEDVEAAAEELQGSVGHVEHEEGHGHNQQRPGDLPAVLGGLLVAGGANDMPVLAGSLPTQSHHDADVEYDDEEQRQSKVEPESQKTCQPASGEKRAGARGFVQNTEQVFGKRSDSETVRNGLLLICFKILVHGYAQEDITL